MKDVAQDALAFANKSLTDGAAAATVVAVPIASNTMFGGELHYTVTATATTDFQVRQGWIKFAAFNNAGTETCTLAHPDGTVDTSIDQTEDTSIVTVTAGTLTYAITCITSATNEIDIQIAADSSLTTPTMTISGWFRDSGHANQTAPSAP